jgi:hypothetical protein
MKRQGLLQFKDHSAGTYREVPATKNSDALSQTLLLTLKWAPNTRHGQGKTEKLKQITKNNKRRKKTLLIT